MDDDNQSNATPSTFDQRKAVRFGCLGIFLVCVLAWGGCRATSFIKWSEGDREGKLIKISYKRWPLAHYEGDLNMGALGKNNSYLNDSMIFHFSINDKAVAEELTEMLGEEVILHYNQYMAKGLVNDTDYIVTKVRLSKQAR